LIEDVDTPWPACLFLKELHIGVLAERGSAFDFLASTITFPVKVVDFKQDRFPEIYPLIKKLGPEITHLTITIGQDLNYGDKHSNIDLSVIIDACPKIEVLDFSTKGRLRNSIWDLQPSHFINYKE